VQCLSLHAGGLAAGALIRQLPSANTRLKVGACTLFDKAIRKKKLIGIACRHQVFAVMLLHMFFVAL